MRDDVSIRVADFFCGCGGTSEGLRQAGMRIALGLDFDRDASATYRMNFPEAAFVEADIRGVTPAEIRAHLPPRDNETLLMSACAPCQPFSTYRHKGREAKKNRALLPALIPFIEDLEPDLLMIENVPGLNEGADGGPFALFRQALDDSGYHAAWDVVDCQNYGVPQRRRRLVLLASRLGAIQLPVATHGRGGLPISTTWDWIADLPPIAAGETHPDDPNHRAAAIGELNMRRLRSIGEGQGRTDWPRELWLDCHRDHRGHSDVYGRLSRNAPAPVLTTKCTSLSNGRFGHPTQDRALSVREAACLQTFPRSFVFGGNLKSATRQVGNAVPVLLARRLGETFIRHVAAQGTASCTGT